MKLIIIFTPLLIIFFSCKKNIPVVNSQPYITNPTSYILKREIWSGPATNGQSFLYSYNEEHLVTTIEQFTWYTYSRNGGPLERFYDTVYNSFEYTNGLCTKWMLPNGYLLYEYNELKLPLKCTSYQMEYIGHYRVQNYSLFNYDRDRKSVV